MPFDRTDYVDRYLIPTSKLKLSAVRDDLFDRYAVTSAMGDDEVATTVKAVRGCWHDIASTQSSTPRLKTYAKLCIGADEQLRSEHRDEMLRASWWKAQARRAEEASKGAVEQLATLLRDTHGKLGVTTQAYLDGCAATLGLTTEQASNAAKQSGIRVLSGDELPKASPLEDSLYRALQTNLATAGVPSVVQLLHPTVKKFSILDGFVAEEMPNARLDGEAVGNQAVEASRQALSTGNDARRAALDVLKTFSARGDLHALALYNLAEIAKRSATLGSIGVQQQLTKIGVQEQDAAAIAVLVDGRGDGAPKLGPERIKALLSEGRLVEATQAVAELPDTFEDKPKILTEVQEARARYDSLATEALQLVKAQDEVNALRKVRDARAISAQEADELLAAIPLPPVLNLIAGTEGASVHLHWQPNTGYPDNVSYVVRRGEGAAPTTLLDGTAVTSSSSSEAVDEHLPVARTLHYSVFANLTRRPISRAASVSVMLVPSPTELRADVGTNSVAVHWTGHPNTANFVAIRRGDANAGSPLPVKDNTVELTGLAEGEPVTIEVIAEFRTPDGRVERSAPANITATPRSQARPIENLRARPSSSGNDSNVAISWRQADSSDTRILRSDSPAPWTFGTWVEAEDLAPIGQVISGRLDRSRGETTLYTRLSEGQLHHLTPFSIGGTGIVVGRATTVGVTAAVQNLKATEFAGFAKLTWLWPEGAGMAEVTWECPGDESDAVGLEKLKRSEYDRDGGFDVPLTAARTEVQVRALMNVGEASFASAPAHLTIDIEVPSAKIDYQLDRGTRIGPFGGRTLTPSFWSRSAVHRVKVVVVAASGPVMPISPDNGIVLHEIELELSPNKVFAAPTVTVPKSVTRPYWVRCFTADESVELVDPPLSKLKES